MENTTYPFKSLYNASYAQLLIQDYCTLCEESVGDGFTMDMINTCSNYKEINYPYCKYPNNSITVKTNDTSISIYSDQNYFLCYESGFNIYFSRLDFFHFHFLFIYHYILPFFILIVYSILFIFCTTFIVVPYYISLSLGYKKTQDKTGNIKLYFNLRVQSFFFIYIAMIISVFVSFLNIIFTWSLSFDFFLVVFVVLYSCILLSFFILSVLFKHVVESTKSKK
jgi:hypothetical protein